MFISTFCCIVSCKLIRIKKGIYGIKYYFNWQARSLPSGIRSKLRDGKLAIVLDREKRSFRYKPNTQFWVLNNKSWQQVNFYEYASHQQKKDRYAFVPYKPLDVSKKLLVQINDNKYSILDSASGVIKIFIQSFLDAQAKAMVSGFMNDTEYIDSTIRIPISAPELNGANMAKSAINNASYIASAVTMIANLRKVEFTPDKNMIRGAFSLLVLNGKINTSMIKSFVPNGVRNDFMASKDILAGEKYVFQIGEVKIF